MKKLLIAVTVVALACGTVAFAQQQFRPSQPAIDQFNYLWFEVIKKDAHGVVGFRSYNADIAVIMTGERVRLAEVELKLAKEVHQMAIETRDKARPEPTQ